MTDKQKPCSIQLTFFCKENYFLPLSKFVQSLNFKACDLSRFVRKALPSTDLENMFKYINKSNPVPKIISLNWLY